MYICFYVYSHSDFCWNFIVLICRKKILNIYVTIWNEFVECVFRVYCNCVHLDYKKFDLHSLIELCFCVIIVILGVTSFACLFKYLDICIKTIILISSFSTGPIILNYNNCIRSFEFVTLLWSGGRKERKYVDFSLGYR